MKIEKLPIITIDDCHNISDVRRKLNLPGNGTGQRLTKQYLMYHNFDYSHFGNKRRNQIKYKVVTKICPVCQKTFHTKQDKKEKITCSHACANTFFRSGLNNPAFNISHKRSNRKTQSPTYKTICFSNHRKECIICGESTIVEVHHYDNNHNNNIPSNLVPLCPTHHQYVHSKHKNKIQKQIDDYVNNFINTQLPN